MLFKYAFLANSAELGQEGRISALGLGIDGILVPSLPTAFPSLAVVACFLFQAEECGRQHHIRVSVLRPDGTPSVESEIVVAPEIVPFAPQRPVQQQMIVNLFNLQVNSEGEHTIVFACEPGEGGAIGFAVRVNPPA